MEVSTGIQDPRYRGRFCKGKDIRREEEIVDRNPVHAGILPHAGKQFFFDGMSCILRVSGSERSVWDLPALPCADTP